MRGPRTIDISANQKLLKFAESDITQTNVRIRFRESAPSSAANLRLHTSLVQRAQVIAPFSPRNGCVQLLFLSEDVHFAPVSATTWSFRNGATAQARY